MTTKTTLKSMLTVGSLIFALSGALQATPMVCEDFIITYPDDFTLTNLDDNSGILRHSTIAYHTEPDSGEEGTLAAYYSTAFGYDDDDISTVTITWTGEAGDPFITNADIYVKAGQGKKDDEFENDGVWRYTAAASWNGMCALVINTGDNVGNAISHVDIRGRSVSVPDGGTTVALFGFSLLGLAGLRRAAARRKA